MHEQTPRFWDIFFEIFESLPRQGVGSRACTARALALCADLPPRPRIVDLGCGVGGQTLDLAELTQGTILAIDKHVPFVERLRQTVADRGLSDRIDARVGDMLQLDVPPHSFDLVWSEGAFFNIGIESALRIGRELLRPRGHIAFSDAVWGRENPPEEVRAAFAEYDTMRTVDQLLPVIADAGFELRGRFTLPASAWWDDFYTPMEALIAERRRRYAGDSEAQRALDNLAAEADMHRRYADYYPYVFFVARLKS
ncbi:MAG TPA: class I SAM-dependent methyltransferase [bacterium]|nr:class I SAM-dependent methyltransferase [bacterium]